MRVQKYVGARLNRRSWMALAISGLSGCGGGGSDTAGLPGTGGTGNLAYLPGTGGTGIYQGSITGFGSVIVNGVTYENSAAEMKLNGVVVSQEALRLGMVATVRGQHDVATATGTASSVDVWAIAQGTVSEVDGDTFKVAGMTIKTTDATWFYDFVSPLANGACVSVWGLQADAEGENWSASCVQVCSTPNIGVSSGLIKVEDGQRTLNELQLTGTLADALPDDVLYRVYGTWNSSDSLNVTSAQEISSSAVAQTQDHVEIEGLVTTTPTATGFMLGNITVQATPSLYEPVNATIVVGSRVEVYGYWLNGQLMATKVELEDTQTGSEVKIKAPIQAFNSLSDFKMQGQRCSTTSGAEISDSARAALPSPGATSSQVFKVKGVKIGDLLMVSSMELDH